MTNTVKVNFCFPKTISTKKEAIINAIVCDIRSDKRVGYAGYIKKEYLKKHLSRYFDDKSINTHRPLLLSEKQKIEKTIKLVTEKCLNQLSLPFLSVYVFPWLGKKYNVAFGGVNGFAPYANTIHLFLSTKKFLQQSLIATITHEFNHAVFFHYRNSSEEMTLLETLIFEGLAENFREDVVGGKTASWSKVLNKVQCQKALLGLKNSLNSTDRNLYHDIFFGSKKYKKWTGYSIGYQIIKSFIKEHPQKSWKEIMKMKPEVIFAMSSFPKK